MNENFLDPEKLVHEMTEGRHLGYKLLPNNRVAIVLPMMFTYRLTVGWLGDKYGYDDCWCYDSPEGALKAMNEWDGQGEPEGWHRHPPSGRRRPDHTPESEYVNP